MIQKKSFDIAVEVTKEHQEVRPGVWAWQMHITKRAADEKQKEFIEKTLGGILASSTQYGLTDTKNLKKFLSNGHTHQINLYWCTPQALEKFRTQGFEAGCILIESFSSHKDKKSFEYHIEMSQDPGNVLIEIDYSSHTIKDVNKKPLPVALLMNYIDNRIDETHCDLLKTARYLMTRDDVVVLKGDDRRGSNKERDFYKNNAVATSPQDAILQIPYYNSEDGRSQSVEFVWQPDAETYQKYWDLAGGSITSLKYFLADENHDVLGLTKAGCRRDEPDRDLDDESYEDEGHTPSKKAKP